MNLLLEFQVPRLPPSVNTMYSRSKYGVFKKESVKTFEWEMIAAFKKRPHIECPIAVFLEFHIRTNEKFRKRDIDNFLKCTFDGLQVAGQIRNDSQIILSAQIKIRDKKNFIKGYIYEMVPGDPSILEALQSYPHSYE